MNHPNRVPFSGVLTRIDEASDKPPSGSRGHRIIITREAATEALPSLLGMAVDCTTDWDNHDARRKVGIITDADVQGADVRVRGFIYGKHFPDVVLEIAAREEKLGMSYEVADGHVVDMRAKIWTLHRITFVGAAILLRAKAAYKNTSFRLESA
jgi:hypothetical protein